MLQNPNGQFGQGLPDEGEVELARSIASATFGALSNHFSSAATIQAAAAAPYSNGLTVTGPVKVSGKFLVTAYLTIDINGGSLADADSVSYQLLVGATPFGPVLWTAASTATGGGAGNTVVAMCSVTAIVSSGVAVGNNVTFSLNIASTNGHTSGVVATTQGVMTAVELPN
jgi:hypothetical protein